MIYYQILCLLTISLLFGCNNNNEKLSTQANEIVQYTVINNTQYSISVIRSNLEWGRWVSKPLSKVNPYGKDVFSSRDTMFAGIEGNVEYSIYDGSFDIYWSLSYWGSVINRLTVNDPNKLYEISRVKKGHNEYIVYINERKSPRQYNVLIMSDPQPWRLKTTGNNPNKDKSNWESVNKKIANSINTLEREKKFSFGIVNGDITEFGRMETKYSFDEIYSSSLNTKLLLGLGNHDYANNVNDCTEPNNLDFSKNACARGAFFDMIKRLDEYKLFLDNYSSDYSKTRQKGSGAYSWDKGDIHYVQLQNYPTYSVILDHYAAKTLYVEKSLDWLENDLRNAYNRGKATVLNYHDDYEHFIENTTSEEKKRLQNMITNYNVMAIFSGHSHKPGQTSFGFINGVMHYNSGALFDGDYLAVAVNNKCIDVSLYDGKSGAPIFIRKFDSICGK